MSFRLIQIRQRLRKIINIREQCFIGYGFGLVHLFLFYFVKSAHISPEVGKNKLLWMIGEIGEVIDIVKQNGGTKACENSEIRKELVEELADVLMYYNDVLLCYGITAEELKQAYTEKFEKNMKRW